MSEYIWSKNRDGDPVLRDKRGGAVIIVTPSKEYAGKWFHCGYLALTDDDDGAFMYFDTCEEAMAVAVALVRLDKS
jgi:hypothetical protein